jgi:hypothetical protein
MVGAVEVIHAAVVAHVLDQVGVEPQGQGAFFYPEAEAPVDRAPASGAASVPSKSPEEGQHHVIGGGAPLEGRQ